MYFFFLKSFQFVQVYYYSIYSFYKYNILTIIPTYNFFFSISLNSFIQSLSVQDLKRLNSQVYNTLYEWQIAIHILWSLSIHLSRYFIVICCCERLSATYFQNPLWTYAAQYFVCALLSICKCNVTLQNIIFHTLFLSK